MLSGCQIGDLVSIYADVHKKCKKGFQKLFEDEGKLFIGNGIVKMQRYQLFSNNIVQKGIAVEVKETTSGCPSIGDDFLPSGTALLQNLPSIICVACLDPQPGDTVLDMCASPGNKTTHIAELTRNQGTIVAIDKTKNKVKQLKALCEKFGAKVHCFEADSTKIVALSQISDKTVCDGPPFSPEAFDRILLDAPCSVLGKRPQIVNRLSKKEIRSYVPIQRKLFESAVKLLKPNGTLVYSTCTITLAENEAMVAWALKTFENLKLIKPKITMGSPGWAGVLADEDRRLVQRFGSECDVDSVGFFFACFVKKKEEK
ncbi:unnamed protein product [Acanthoscelides obtectus]|uniref:SAM-dependent MTase RsmB/NOP-type domain-containing protein n=1 Tax=Acanthoscelides obtectus TaxID=200917 RepID=A0A9P0PWN1_ACAOB|nr:unnamed protein product [Acanthoscelides obtectus]CAK1645163.1 Putative methyltransferase NSUN6 [Acanthoscelides obtectus]